MYRVIEYTKAKGLISITLEFSQTWWERFRKKTPQRENYLSLNGVEWYLESTGHQVIYELSWFLQDYVKEQKFKKERSVIK